MSGSSPMTVARGAGLLVLIASGGALGAGVRSIIQQATIELGGSPAVWLLIVNLAGAFILGMAFVRLDPRTPTILDLADIEVPATERPGARTHHPVVSAFLAVGFCGALTTWSSLAVAVTGLWTAGHATIAIGLLLASIALGPIAVACGAFLGRPRS